MDTPAQHRKNQAKFQKKPTQVHKRVLRNAARKKMQQLGLVHKGDGMDVDHVHGTGMGNGRRNLRILTKHKNRDYRRTSSGKQIRHP